MKKLIFDSGVQEFEVNGGEILRFNPTDTNVYNRFFQVAEEITAFESDFVKKAEAFGDGDAAGIMKLMAEYDTELKTKLKYIFGEINDFDKMLGGVNLMAVATNGERVIANLFAALQPIIEDGAQLHAQEKAAAAVTQAKENREQRRAAK